MKYRTTDRTPSGTVHAPAPPRLVDEPPLPRHTVTVGPFEITDLDRATVLQAISNATARQQRTVVFSLHVGGLNHRHDPEFTTALRQADFLLPDGISVALLVKLAGGSTHRHPTTDAGWQLLGLLAERWGRPVRVALIGGPAAEAGRAGLGERAGQVMAAQPNVEVVAVDHGFHRDWTDVLSTLRAAAPDVVLVGMGMPAEARWVAEHREQLPAGLILTCGGWFGHIVGDERRAPQWMRRAGLEWLARLAQSPGRLWRRYASGLWTVVVLAPAALRGRRRAT